MRAGEHPGPGADGPGQPSGRDGGDPPRRLVRAVQEAGERLCRLYALDLESGLERFVVSPAYARRFLPEDAPRTGLLVLQEETEAWVALYVDPRDLGDPGAILEETSHLVCLSWHAAQGRPVSRLTLELQAEVDRYALARFHGADALAHFHRFRWLEGLSERARRRYQTAHEAAHGYCRSLQRRFPRRADMPGWLAELRRFYRTAPQAKLAWTRG